MITEDDAGTGIGTATETVIVTERGTTGSIEETAISGTALGTTRSVLTTALISMGADLRRPLIS